jgi:DNA-binding CsgD family transcriptional regulator
LVPLKLKGTRDLTSREGEVAGLVAEGLRNNEIAERLSLSTHTIKNYLYRAYEKLGVSSRVELAALVLAPKLAGRHVIMLPDHKRLAG